MLVERVGDEGVDGVGLIGHGRWPFSEGSQLGMAGTGVKIPWHPVRREPKAYGRRIRFHVVLLQGIRVLIMQCADPLWICWIEAHPGLASWVQAVGTIAALVIALMVPIISQSFADRAARRRHHHRMTEAVVAAAGSAAAFAEAVAQTENTEKFWLIFPKHSFDQAEAALLAAQAEFHFLNSVGRAQFIKFRLLFTNFVNNTALYDDFRSQDKLAAFSVLMKERADEISETMHRLLDRPSLRRALIRWLRSRLEPDELPTA
jgi:hypothetical protein